MTRAWVSRTDERWVMKCDRLGCTTTSEPFPAGRQPSLDIFRARGWYIAPLFGDRCPACVGVAANDGPGWDGRHISTGECFACMVGVATGPESHAEDCPERKGEAS